MKILFLFNRNPYDGTDVTWNGLRLAQQLVGGETDLRIFLMNDSVDLARGITRPPEGYFDLSEMLKELVSEGVPLKVCGTCKARCGIHKGEPYFEAAKEAKISELAEWVKEADKIITF
jgi:uncharacterized protein involved in oxidation of intracellular sulfur